MTAANKNRFDFSKIKTAQAKKSTKPVVVKVDPKDGWKHNMGIKPLLAHPKRRHPKGEMPIEVYLHHKVESKQLKLWECGSIIAFAKQVGCVTASEKDFDDLVKHHDVGGVKAWKSSRPKPVKVEKPVEKASAPAQVKKEESKGGK